MAETSALPVILEIVTDADCEFMANPAYVHYDVDTRDNQLEEVADMVWHTYGSGVFCPDPDSHGPTVPSQWIKGFRVPWLYQFPLLDSPSSKLISPLDEHVRQLGTLFAFSLFRHVFRISERDLLKSGYSSAAQRQAVQSGLLPRFALTSDNVAKFVQAQQDHQSLIAEQLRLLTNVAQEPKNLQQVFASLPPSVIRLSDYFGLFFLLCIV